MIVRDFVKQAYERYGDPGDGTLEYAGVSISGGIKELRVYRKKFSKADAGGTDRVVFDRLLALFDPILSENGARVCDYSTRSIGHDKAYRIIFLLPADPSPAELKLTIDRFAERLNAGERLSGLFDTAERFRVAAGLKALPLWQVGAEVLNDMTPVSVKYYLLFDKAGIDAGSLPAMLKDLIQALDFPISGEDFEKLARDSLILYQNGFAPVFFGVNDSFTEKEVKLYFKSHALGYRPRELLSRTKLLGDKLGWSAAFSDGEIDEILGMKFHLAGAAASLNDPSLWRLYLEKLRI